MTQDQFDKEIERVKTGSARYIGMTVRSGETVILIVVPYSDHAIEAINAAQSAYGLDNINRFIYGTIANHLFIEFNWDLMKQRKES